MIDQYGNDDPQFDNTTQKSNPWIFRIKNVLGEHYFAADNEQGMKEWLHHLNWAIGSGPDKVVNKVTKGQDFKQKHEANKQQKYQKGQFLDDDYLEQHDENQQKKNEYQQQNNQYNAYQQPQKQQQYQAPKQKEVSIVKLQRPKNAEVIFHMAQHQYRMYHISHSNSLNNQKFP